MLDQVTGIRTDAILKLYVVDAENLPNRSHTVKARQGQNYNQTSF